MMNELQRQHYLSALGLDTYMPRWHLPFAPVSVACQLPEFIADDKQQVSVSVCTPDSSRSLPSEAASSLSPGTAINSLIGDIFAVKKAVKVELPPVAVAELLADTTAAQAISPFSLSVWRPLEGLMIIDSRNTQLALPTDALLKNILRASYPQVALNLKEEVLRCPMIENSFVKRTADDARAELQTWLSVQSEIKPVEQLWLMGDNAIQYLSANADAKTDHLWGSSAMAGLSIRALLLPSLNELLLSPGLKQSLFSALRGYQYQIHE